MIIDQLAHTTLLPETMATAILTGDKPPIEEIVTALVIGAMDCETVVRSDSTSTWNERRIARAILAVAFLTALAAARQ